MLGKALLESIRLMDGKVIFSYITKKGMSFFGVKAKDLEGIVSQLRVTAGVEVAIFLYELESGEFKVSLRSKERWTSARWHGILAGRSCQSGRPYFSWNRL